MPAKRILIFNVNWLGDVLFSTATIRNIRYNFPDSYIACIIPSRCYPVLEGNPNLNELIIFDEKSQHKGMLEIMKFTKMLAEKKFDLVYLLHRSMTRALICRLAGIPERIGYYTKKRGFLLTQRIVPPNRDAVHRIDYYLNVIQKAGLKAKDRHTDFFFSSEDRSFSEDFLTRQGLKNTDFLVGINAGGNWDPKRWPKEYWAKLADRLIREFNAKVIITGGDKDVELAKSIRDLMHEEPVIACGLFSLKAFAALCKRLDLFITADTGPLHIANAAGAKKIIALFGPTHQDITGPVPADNVVILGKEIECQIPCYVVDCADNRCMKAISVNDVVDQVKRLRK